MKKEEDWMKLVMNKVIHVTLILVVMLCVTTKAHASLAAKAWAGDRVDSAMLSSDVAKRGKSNPGKSLPKRNPTQSIKELDDMLGEFKSGKNLTAKDEEHNRGLKMKIIHGTFDVRELSRLALAKHWNGLTPQERSHFVDLMVSLLEEKALFSKEQSAAKSKAGGKYRVVYRGHKYLGKDKKKAYVRTKVIIPSENIDIALSYKLRKHDGQWKIYDVIVDEASLVSNYKYQFNSIITKHSYDDLVSRMTKKLNEIKAKRQ
jgi:phospholipid transport system substrate-binding protein